MTRLGPIFILAAIFFTNFLARIILAPLMPAIQLDLGLSHRDAGSLFLLISLGYFIALLGSGYLAARFTHRQMILGACLGVGLALLGIASMGNAVGVRLGVVGLGFAAGLYLPSGIASLTHLAPPAQWGRVLAIHEMAPNLAFLLAPILAEFALSRTSWRVSLFALGGLTLLMAVLFAWLTPNHTLRGRAPNRRTIRALATTPALWRMILLFSAGIAGTLGVYSVLPLYLVSNHGLERQNANMLLSLSRVLTLGAAWFGGWATDRFGARTTIRGVLWVSGFLVVALGLLRDQWLAAAVVAQPILAVCFFPAGFSQLTAVSPEGTSNLAVSLTIPAAFLLGGGCAPLFFGWMGDRGGFPTAFVVVGATIALSTLATAGLPHRRPRV
jgi:NNP family nitrate/nitrite transporter-like MFS transporter